jgi:hypothetical protein
MMLVSPELSNAKWDQCTVLFEFMGNLDILSNFVDAMGFAPFPPPSSCFTSIVTFNNAQVNQLS